MVLGGERVAVQFPLIRYAQEAGWEYLPPEEALRLRGGKKSGLVLGDLLISQLQKLNPGVVDRQGAEEVVKRLLRVSPSIEGNLEAWEYMKGLKTLFIEAERRERNVRLLDPVNVGANTFHVTDEFPFESGNHRIRADVVFLINGIPVIIVEAKAATRKEGISEALEQVSAGTIEKAQSFSPYFRSTTSPTSPASCTVLPGASPAKHSLTGGTSRRGTMRRS